jgi:hypothetical protein
MTKACPFKQEYLLSVIDSLPLFHAQQRVNDWHRAYGYEAIKDVQEELDRRRRKLVANDPGVAASEVEIEADYYAELERGYARDRK